MTTLEPSPTRPPPMPAPLEPPVAVSLPPPEMVKGTSYSVSFCSPALFAPDVSSFCVPSLSTRSTLPIAILIAAKEPVCLMLTPASVTWANSLSEFRLIEILLVVWLTPSFMSISIGVAVFTVRRPLYQVKSVSSSPPITTRSPSSVPALTRELPDPLSAVSHLAGKSTPSSPPSTLKKKKGGGRAVSPRNRRASQHRRAKKSDHRAHHAREASHAATPCVVLRASDRYRRHGSSSYEHLAAAATFQEA